MGGNVLDPKYCKGAKAREGICMCPRLVFFVDVFCCVLISWAPAFADPIHTADQNADRSIDLPELLRVIQFYNALGYHCDSVGEDGYAPGQDGDHMCTPHDGDYNAQDWKIGLSELLRMIQFYNSGGYYRAADSEDGFAPDPGSKNMPVMSDAYVPFVNTVLPNAPGYTLPISKDAIMNYGDFDTRFGLAGAQALIEANGFAIMEYDLTPLYPEQEANDDIILPYTYFNELNIPVFITADTLLHLYHVQFDESLKDVEEREFLPDITALTAALLEALQAEYAVRTGDLQEAARRNIAYLAVAQKLLDPSAVVSELVADDVAAELARIEAHAGFAASDIFIYEEDYSQYVPRGHYTRSADLERYFKAFMWYGRMAFLLKGDEDWGPSGEALVSVEDARIQTLQAVLLAQAIEGVSVGGRTGRAVWERIYAITAFYVGLADDLTPYEYLEVINRLFGDGFDPAGLENDDTFFDLKAELALLRSPQIYGGTGNIFLNAPVTPESLNETLDKTKGMRFLGQRFIPDSYMFQKLVFPSVLDYTGGLVPLPFSGGDTGGRLARCYPRGLDVMALMGSDLAAAILENGGDTDYLEFYARFQELQTMFGGFTAEEWNRNLYWGWLYALKALLVPAPAGYPNFIRTEAWQKKALNTALASWTELRHDTILYAKQSYGQSETSIPEPPPGYVEPAPEFFGRLLALTEMTRVGLTAFDALSETATQRLLSLENLLQQLIAIVNKELVNEPLAKSELLLIKSFGDLLQSIVLGVAEEGIKTTLVADVHTHSAEALVVEEGVGDVDLIFVACPASGGDVFLTVGAVFSYYEFKHAMDDRLTDEAWRDLLHSPERPERPEWFQPLMP